MNNVSQAFHLIFNRLAYANLATGIFFNPSLTYPFQFFHYRLAEGGFFLLNENGVLEFNSNHEMKKVRGGLLYQLSNFMICFSMLIFLCNL
jgi:hypothetical protein